MMWGTNNFWGGGWPFTSLLLLGPFLVIFAIVEIVLKGYALWFSARRGQKVWFIVLLVVNTLGILPLIYLLINRNKKNKK